jgi:formylglycine-generating enzyme required for sulfatase activity
MFCDWLTTNDPKWIYRLPTESEWECAKQSLGEEDLTM